MPKRQPQDAIAPGPGHSSWRAGHRVQASQLQWMVPIPGPHRRSRREGSPGCVVPSQVLPGCPAALARPHLPPGSSRGEAIRPTVRRQADPQDPPGGRAIDASTRLLDLSGRGGRQPADGRPADGSRRCLSRVRSLLSGSLRARGASENQALPRSPEHPLTPTRPSQVIAVRTRGGGLRRGRRS